MNNSRRQFLKVGLLGGMALGLAGKLAGTSPQRGFVATADDRTLIAALSRGMLGSMPVDEVPLHTNHVLKAIAGLPPASQQELRQLFALLQQPLARRLMGLQPAWREASAEQVASLLQGWRSSRLALLRGAYQGLHSLLYAAWYGDERHWAAIAYQLPASMKGLINE